MNENSQIQEIKDSLDKTETKLEEPVSPASDVVRALLSCAIDRNSKLENIVPIVEVCGEELNSIGSVFAVGGLQKARKTSFLSSIYAECIYSMIQRKQDPRIAPENVRKLFPDAEIVCHIKPTKPNRILWFDLEMSHDEVITHCRRAFSYLIDGCENGIHAKDIDYFAKVISFKDFKKNFFKTFLEGRDFYGELRNIIEAAVKELKPEIVVIDGALNLCEDFQTGNVESLRVIEWLKDLPNFYNCGVTTVIHENPTSLENARTFVKLSGSGGSHAMRGFTVCSHIYKDPDSPNIRSFVEWAVTRNHPIESLTIEQKPKDPSGENGVLWDERTQINIFKKDFKPDSKTSAQILKGIEEQELNKWHTIFGEEKILSFTQISALCAAKFDVKERRSADIIRAAVNSGYLLKDKNKRYMINETRTAAESLQGNIDIAES